MAPADADVASVLDAARPAGVPRRSLIWRARADAHATRAARVGHRAIAWPDPRYPAALALRLGCSARCSGYEVAARRPLTGRRSRSSDRGRDRGTRCEVGGELGRGACASRGVVVVSGLARGVDSAAHPGALDSRGLDRGSARVRRGYRLSGRACGAGGRDCRTRRRGQRAAARYAAAALALSAAQPDHQRPLACRGRGGGD